MQYVTEEAFALDEPAPPPAVVETPAPVIEEAEAAPVLETETTPDAEPASDRNADGTFKAKAKPRDDPQARIDQVIARQREAERRADAAEAELATYKAPKPAAEPAKADAEPTPEQFDSYEKYVKAQARWEARQEITAAEGKARERWEADQAKAAEQTRMKTWQDRLAKARAATPDFDSRLKGDLQLTAPMVDAIKDSDLGPELLLHLSEHPDTVQRLSTLPPIQTIRELGKLEATLEAAARGSVSAPKASNAKAPIQPLGTSPSARDDDDSDDLSVEAHIRRENAKDAKRRRGN